MRCPAPERLAELATEGCDDDELLAHLGDCAECRAIVDGQRGVRAWLAETSLPDLPRAQRESLAAEVLARADILAAPSTVRARGWTAAIALVAAAALAGVIGWPRGSMSPDMPAQPRAELPTTSERVAGVAADTSDGPAQNSADAPQTDEPAPPRARIEGTGEFSRSGDVVTLAGGDVTIDAPRERAMAVVTGDTAVRARAAKVKVVAVRGAISQVQVFAGSAEVTIAGKTVIVEQGMTWTRPEAPEVGSASAQKFRDGWEALRAGQNAQAVADFDEATDEDVAEDALYWAAVASERRKDLGGAMRRYRQLIDRFPKSPRITAATAALERLEAR